MHAMMSSSSLGTILEAAAHGEGIETKCIGLWGDLVHSVLADKVAGNLNSCHVSNESTGWAATSCRHVRGSSFVLILALP
jgi:hypothetical protein